ncbi:MAG TPA: hypothetical protein VJT54_09415 [Verrucomicrobiae bacterium]|nr:hypothetical protein [Verrucomicrobiae bacterium]
MSTVTKGLFALLVAAMIVSVVLCYQGIAKLRQDHYPPFLPPAMMLESSERISHPSQAVILFLDSNEGKILVGCLTMAVPMVCGILVGKKKWQLWSFVVLIGCAVLFCWMGIAIYLHSIYDAFLIENP